MISRANNRMMLEYEVFAPYTGISCFVTTRHGGCSTGPYASFNCTPYTGDDPSHVSRNRELLCKSLPQCPEELIIPHQNHGTRSLIIDRSYSEADEAARNALLEGVDALITQEPG